MFVLNRKVGTLHRSKDPTWGRPIVRNEALCGKDAHGEDWFETKEPPRSGVRHICKTCERLAAKA